MPVLLIAEDDPDVRHVLSRVFVRAGFTVLAEPDGAAALDRARHARPDVVLTDFDMPRMNGLDLCHAIRRDAELRDIPVAILSGRLQPDDPRVPDAHLCVVLLKPFGNADLVAAITDLAAAGPHHHAVGASVGRGAQCPGSRIVDDE